MRIQNARWGGRGGSRWARLWRWLTFVRVGWGSRPQRQLRLCETLGLGERRFLAVVEFEQQRFLIAGTASSVALLAELPAPPERQDAMTGEPAVRGYG
jgi:flagellar biogenesis protein FliO